MILKIGQWTIEHEAGYIRVSFPLGEHDVDMYYSAHGKDAQHFIGVNIDQEELIRIPLPESETEIGK